MIKIMQVKIKISLIAMVALLFLWGSLNTFALETQNTLPPLKLTGVQERWLQNHADKKLILGLDPSAGMEYFKDGDAQKGYMLELAAHLSQRLGVQIKIEDSLSWGGVYQGLQDGTIDLLFGANPTPERLKVMAFTAPVYSVPYTVMARNGGDINTIGDLHSKRIGFISEDIGISLFKGYYQKVQFETVLFENQERALEALSQNRVDGFITSGGDVVYDYLSRYPTLKQIVQIDAIKSELTLSALKANEQLVDVVQEVLNQDRALIDQMITRARQAYLQKIIKLSPEEKAWLDDKPLVKVGVPTDYLPIDFDNAGKYGGIAGTYLTKFANLIGIEIQPIAAPFDTVYTMALKGEVDVLNMAKTEERLANFIFTEPFSNERDLIYGDRDSAYVNDTYGLEGKRVAVIEGFWHEQYLERNLRNVEIIKTKDIQSSLKLVATGQADYLIETPAVAEYYLSGLGYTEILKKGETSADSFLYFGVSKDMAMLVSIFNKMAPLMDYEEAKYLGVQGLPKISNIENNRLYGLLIMSGLFLTFLLVAVSTIAFRLSKQSAQILMMKERERLIYLDPLTELYNRNYFNHIEPKMDQEAFPQYLVMFDINDLKLVNDRFGHLIGDQMIKAFALQLKELDPSATAIRMGGDEFILWINGVKESDVKSLIQRLRFKCAQISLYSLGDQGAMIQNGIHVAMGYSGRTGQDKTVEQCLQEADAAMYHDKEHMKSILLNPDLI